MPRTNSPRRNTRSSAPRTPRVSSDTTFSYKDAQLLGRFVSEQGYIVGRSKTGLSQKQQRRLAQEIKRARHLALLPYTQTV